MHVALSQVTIDKLQAFGRRRRMLIGVRGFCAGVIALLGVMSVVALLDRFVVLADSTRLALSLIGYLVVIAVAWLTCLRMVMHIPGEKELAKLVETVSPGLRENLVAAVELGSPDSDSRFDSETFRNLLQRDVATKMDAVKIESLLPPGLVGRWVRIACVVLMICVGLMLIPGLEFGNMLTRALIPMANVDRVSNVRVRLVAPNPGNPLVPHNEAVDVVIEHVSGPKPDRVFLETIRHEQGRENEELLMKPTGTANQYSATIQVGREPVTYRVLAGDAVTKKYTITSASRPHVVSFQKTYRFPQYTRRQDQTIQDSNGDIRALEGTIVELVIKTDQPVTSGELHIESPGKSMQSVPLTVGSDNEVRATVPVESTATYKVHLVANATTFTNPFDPQYEIIADPDKPPTVELRQPLQNLLMPGDEIVRMLAIATDDMGLDTVAQMIRVNNGRWIEVVVGENAGTDMQVRRNMDLFDLAVKPGDRIQTRFAATDYAGNKGESTVLTVTVSSSGFDPNRFSAIQAKQKIYAALADLAKTTTDYALTVRQNGQRLGGGELQRQQALQNMADAADQIQRRADAALTQVQESLRLIPSGSDAYDLVLVGRLFGRVRDDWAASVAGSVSRAIATYSSEVLNAEAERAQNAIVAASQALTQAEVGFRHLLAADEVDAILRDLISLSEDQKRIDPKRWPDEADTWQRLSRRQSAVATQLRLLDDIAKQLSTRGDGEAFDHVRAALAAWIQPRDAAERALAAPKIDAAFGQFINGMAAGLHVARQRIQPAAKALAELANVDGRQRIEKAVGSQWNFIQSTHDGASEAYQTNQVLLDQRARGAGDVIVSRVEAQAAAASQRNQSNWQSGVDHFKQVSTLNESRSDSDSQFVADMGLARRAMQSLRVKYDSNEAREAVASLSVIAKAFQTLEAGHGVAELLSSVKAQSAREKWLRSRTDAVTLHARDWDWSSSHMDHVSSQMRKASLPAAAVELLQQTRSSDEANRISVEMARRRTAGTDLQKQAADLDVIAKQIARVQALIAEDMIDARRLIADQAPKVSEMMAKLADDAEKLAADAEQAKRNVAEDSEPDDASKKEVEELAEKQEALSQQLDDLADALKEDANVQDVFTDKGRERARDADDALAMVRQPAEEAEQAVKQADAQIKNDQKPEAALNEATNKDEQLAKNLRQLAEHFENVEQDKGEQTRAALRDAERDLGIKRDLDQEFGRMEKLADIASLDPQQQLNELEKELEKNASMKRELSEISRDAVADAREQLNEAAAQEKRIAQDLEATKTNEGAADSQVDERLKELAKRAEQMAERDVAKVAAKAFEGSPKAQKPLANAMKALEKAADAIPRKQNEQRQDPNQASDANAHRAEQAAQLQKELQKAADSLKQATKAAGEDVEQLRTDERNDTAKLALGDTTPEVRAAAAERIKEAPKQQEAARDTRDASEDVARDAQKLADQAAKLARELQRITEEDKANLANAAKQQQPVGEAVDQAKQDVARAVRHEERLGNEKGAEQLAQADKGIEQAAKNVAKAEQQLAKANAKSVQEVVEQASKSIDKERENLDNILGQPQPRYSDENGNPLPDAPQGNPLPDEPEGNDPQNGEPQSGESKNGEQKAGEPKDGAKQGEPNGKPKTGEPKAGESKAGQPKNGESKSGQPKSGEPKSGQSKSGQPGKGKPKSGEPKSGQPQQGDPATDPDQFAQNRMDKAMKNAADALEAGKQSPQDQAAAKWMARALDELDRATQPDSSKSMAKGDPQAGQPQQGEQNGQPQQGQPGQSKGESGKGEPGQGEPGKSEPGQGKPGQGEPGQGEQPGGQGQAGKQAMAQAAEAVRQAAQAQAQAMAQARQAGQTPGQGEPGQGEPGQGQPGQSQQGQPTPPGAPQPGQGMAQGQPGQGQQPSDEPGKQPDGQGQQSGKGAAVAGSGQGVGQMPDRAAIKRGEWGKLPPKLAEDLLEGERNGVAPEYRDLVEAYFRAIARKARDSKFNKR